MIFNIQKCSIHDGEGLRTTVFFKGCPLRCLWCANPESQIYGHEIMEFPSRCIGCGLCRKICPELAVKEDIRIDRNLCSKDCFACTDICYAEAKKMVGKAYSIEDLLKEIEKDRFFYETSGGGVTFSGGEPLTFGKYLTEIAAKCKENKINVALESCGYGPFEEFKSALPYIDFMFLDIKHIDPVKHKEMTGVGNEQILENIKKISEYGVPLTIRTPVVPGYTNSPSNIKGIAGFIKTLPTVRAYELLAYHNLGESKYAALGRTYRLPGAKTPSNDEMNALSKEANSILHSEKIECFWMNDNTRQGACNAGRTAV